VKKFITSLTDIDPIAEYLARIGAEERSLRAAVIKDQKGAYWVDVCVVRFTKDGVLLPKGMEEYEPTDAEAKAIERAMDDYQWPTSVPVDSLADLPEEVRAVDPDNRFVFRNTNDQIVMVQVRIENAKGERAYVPWSYWSDGKWRRAEPEGPLPLWGLENIGDHTVAFVHEGAKAARRMQQLFYGADKEAAREHPWYDELSVGVHIGWIGGALSPRRTDWTALKKAGIKRLYIVSDNDAPGNSAVPQIAEQNHMPCYHVQFTQQWPASFDLGDEFPKHFFRKKGDNVFYIGPSFRDCVQPATWATDMKPSPTGKGRPHAVLRDHFAELWAYIEEVDMFVCKEMPTIIRTDKILNNMLSAFSHVSNTTQHIVKAYRGRQTKLCYRPDEDGRMIMDDGSPAINLHVPTSIKPAKGDIKPFLQFMEYMFPNSDERHTVMRWCKTLIAHPEVRMEYGLLLVSVTQGVGKTTLGSRILAPLVGLHNVSQTQETEIVDSNFNGWVANRRLVVVNEIYAGHSWKAYNKLKELITDKMISVNKKYERPYMIQNWAHFFCCSNSMQALKMEGDDRRWFYPMITEKSWDKRSFQKFYDWLESGGLSIIYHWALNSPDIQPVTPGERAPMTARKKMLIEESRSEAQQEAVALANEIKSRTEPLAISTKASHIWIINSDRTQKVYDKEFEIRKVMKDEGLIEYERRLKIGGRMHYVLLNESAYRGLEGKDENERNSFVRSHLTGPEAVFNEVAM